MLNDCEGAGKLPHQSKTYQVTTVQSAAMFLLAHYFPKIDPEVFIAWGMVSAYILRKITFEKIRWYW